MIKIWTFMVSVLLGASVAGAEEVVLRFDGEGAGRNYSIAEALIGASAQQPPQPGPTEPVAYRDGNKVVFGEDDRVEYFQVPEKFKTAADSTVSLWQKGMLALDKETGNYALPEINYGESYKLCPGVKFAEQNIGTFCSGSLVGEDLILTAGHCIKNERVCKDTKFVFGFALSREGGKGPLEVGPENVYNCAEVIKRDWTNYTESHDGGPEETIFGQDYALIRLDRKVIGRRPLRLNRAGGIKKGDAVTAMGHPSGLPLKFSAYAAVVKPVEERKPYFTTNLDIFGGNSGGPAFNARTGLIEGIVVRADGDHFLPTFEGCNIFHVKPQNAGYGVDVNKLEEVLSLIPPLPGEPGAMSAAI